MKVNELSLRVFLLKDIYREEMLNKISELIDKTLCKSEEFLNYHKTNTYKYYTFNGFWPIEKSKIYKEGNLYFIKIRTVNDKISKYLMKNLANEYTTHIKGLTIEHKIIPKKYINEIYTITPVVIKTDSGYWKSNFSIQDFERKIKENLIKKYNCFFDTKINEDFEMFHRIRFDNHKPIAYRCKEVTLLGDKITVTIAENEMAQELAYLALGASIGEVSARGFGFVNYRYL